MCLLGLYHLTDAFFTNDQVACNEHLGEGEQRP